jgi:hypothetical protein
MLALTLILSSTPTLELTREHLIVALQRIEADDGAGRGSWRRALEGAGRESWRRAFEEGAGGADEGSHT